jgi:AraC-like DNA-binding protein/quercetin dioxygenase-like cupin family protein
MENLKYYPSHQTETFSFSHVHIKNDQQVPLHQQETWELAYIIKGSGVRMIGDMVENFTEGEVVLLPPDIPHCWSFDKNVVDEKGKIENICVFFKKEFLETCKDNFPQLRDAVEKILKIRNAISFSGKSLAVLQRLMKTMSRQNEVEKLSSLILILDHISSSETVEIVGKPLHNHKSEKKMNEINMFVLNHFHREISLDEVSKYVGMPTSSFCVFFKKMMGKSFISYLTEFRIETSCQLLLKTSMAVSEVSIASGFNDIPYYNRVFKKLKKCTPKEFRAQNKALN